MRPIRSALFALALTAAAVAPSFAQTPGAPGTTAQKPAAAVTGTPSGTVANRPLSSSTKPGDAAKPGELVDLNSATAAELDALPGIGKARADAIIKNRPYKGKDDLVNRHVLPKNVYDGIKDKVIARQG